LGNGILKYSIFNLQFPDKSGFTLRFNRLCRVGYYFATVTGIPTAETSVTVTWESLYRIKSVCPSMLVYPEGSMLSPFFD
jgi:hypothetical protein